MTTPIKADLIEVMGLDDESQSELYTDILEYAQQQCQDILDSGASEEVKQKVEADYRLMDEKLKGLLDFFKNHKLSDFVYNNLRKEGLSDLDIDYVLSMLSDETYMKFMQSYNASMRVYSDIVVGLIDYGIEAQEASEAPTDTLNSISKLH